MFEHYVLKGNKKLRYGYTTGTCGALASKAATIYLLTDIAPSMVSLTTPKGIEVCVKVIDAYKNDNFFICGVKKYSGDDPDVTDGVLIYAKVSKLDENKILIDGGIGVGRITKKGLDMPVGEAAINKVPRQMITKEVRDVCNKEKYCGGISVLIEIPQGKLISEKTFNKNLGIVGGLSVIGTSGIVEPMSTKALLDSIQVELKMLSENNIKKIILTPGNYGKNFIEKSQNFANIPVVTCSNFIGETFDNCVYLNFEEIILIGHVGKLIKLAGGIMDTHSKNADCRMELLALHASLVGANNQLVKKILQSVTVDDGISLLTEINLAEKVFKSISNKIKFYLKRRTGDKLKFSVIVFSNVYGILINDTKNII